VQTGAKVYLACRSLEKAQHAVDDIVNQTGISSSQLPILQLDLNSLKSVRSFASSFKRSKQLTDSLITSIYCFWPPIFPSDKIQPERRSATSSWRSITLISVPIDKAVRVEPEQVQVAIICTIYDNYNIF